MLIRQLGIDDAGLLDAAVRMFRGMEVADHGPFLADAATIAMVATEEGAVVGWVWGLRQRHVCGYSQVQLYEIEVAAPARRRGVGRALLTAFLELARREGHRKVWLFTDHGNTAAKALYGSSGAEPSRHDDAGYWWRLDRG